MASKQLNQMVELYASIKERSSNPDLDLATIDVSLHALREGQHNFLLGAGRVPEVDLAIEEIARWLRSMLGLAASSSA